ncbi:BZ3500_MvSof-1268-A1-R1_Chr7-1g09073 [Microbotryum saponariae]|uniref:BZ3500_MvSof-1268-A1-R1_Chr7-1g09073 protein n=1 Tax=Microbotryum saponariae TaxID=289078 RepID=A0A2X0LTW6_9BASI|nr:BZ3501_MvSof-1269-A2-R1_Chr7-1g08777 [Microbotryum saponariae]SDA02743.1 BZ3500_MvSof-1268-A1-R1_Chr7-1g09073 [Microbotryum saponariae]
MSSSSAYGGYGSKLKPSPLVPPTPSTTLFEFDEPATPSVPSSSTTTTPTLPNPRSSSEFYPPRPIKSLVSSREAQFDQDDDELGDEDDDAQHQREEHEPLMMQGLLHSNRSRSSFDQLGKPTSSNPLGDPDRIPSQGTSGAPRLLRQLEADPEVPEWVSTGAGLLANIANMSNSILGAGIIGLPYALREAGFVMGIFLLVVLGVVTDWTIRMIVLNAKMSGRRTYIDIMDTCFGPHGRAAVSFFQFAFAFGGMCAFCVILGDTVPRVLVAIVPGEHSPFLRFLMSRQFVITILTVGVSYPLSLYRDIAKLSGASTLALISMVVIVVSVGVRGPSVADNLKGDASERWTFINSGFFEAIGVISFAFVVSLDRLPLRLRTPLTSAFWSLPQCHHNSLLIYGSLKTPTLDRFAKVTHVSTSLSVIACLAMSTSGFLVFTNKTAGNILNNFASDDVLINVARTCVSCRFYRLPGPQPDSCEACSPSQLGANMFTTLPLEAFVCREVLENYFWPDQPFDRRRHLIITSALVLSAMVVSLMTCDLGLVLELAGGFSATALAYLFPAACYLKLTSTSSSSKNARTRFAAWTCALFGVAVMILSTFLSINKALNGEGHKTC